MRTSIRSRGGKHVDTTIGYIREVVRVGEWKTISDINPADVEACVEIRRDTHSNGARTLGAVMTAIKGFSKWLVDHDKHFRDPLRVLKKPDPKSNPKLIQRFVLPEEWRWLRAVTASAERYDGITGEQRVVLYAAAHQTGLRSGERRSLKVSQLKHLDREKPYVLAKSDATKNGERAQQDIKRELTDAILRMTTNQTASDRVFAMPEGSKVAKLLRLDLVRARQAWLEEAKAASAELAKRE